MYPPFFDSYTRRKRRKVAQPTEGLNHRKAAGTPTHSSQGYRTVAAVVPDGNGITPPAHWPAGLCRRALDALAGVSLSNLFADYGLPAVAGGPGVELRRRNAIAEHIGARPF